MHWMRTSFLVLLAGLVADGFSPEARGPSRMFLETADPAEWEALLPLGIFHGVTTNPSLLEDANVPCDIENLHGMAYKAIEEYKMNEFMTQCWGGE